MANNSNSENENVKWYLSGFTENFIEKLESFLKDKLKMGASPAKIKRDLKGIVSEVFDDTPDADEIKEYKKKIVRKTVAYLEAHIDELAKEANKVTSRSNTIKKAFAKRSFLRNTIGRSKRRRPVAVKGAAANTMVNEPTSTVAAVVNKKSMWSFSGLKNALMSIMGK